MKKQSTMNWLDCGSGSRIWWSAYVFRNL